MNTNDQYGNPIPADLTLLNSFDELEALPDNQIKAIDNLDWYCFEGNKTRYIFVSQAKLEEILGGTIDNFSPDDVCCRVVPRIIKIDSVLHRWNEKDGFYWA